MMTLFQIILAFLFGSCVGRLAQLRLGLAPAGITGGIWLTILISSVSGYFLPTSMLLVVTLTLFGIQGIWEHHNRKVAQK
jgi:hypothetical protein